MFFSRNFDLWANTPHDRMTSKMIVEKDENFTVFTSLTGRDTKSSFGQSQPCQMTFRPIKKGS